MLKPVFVFTSGVVVGIEIHRIVLKMIKYSDKCPIKDCNYRAFSTSPEGMIWAMQKHYRENHPGWKSAYKV